MNYYRQYIGKTYIFKNKKIFIQDIKNVGGLIIVQIDGDILTFKTSEIQEDFFNQIHTKIDDLKKETYESKINTTTPLPIMNSEFHQPKKYTPEKPNIPQKVNQNNILLQLNNIDALDGSTELTEILKSALKNINDAKDSNEIETAIKKAKVISELGNTLNNNIKNRVQAISTALKYNNK